MWHTGMFLLIKKTCGAFLVFCSFGSYWPAFRFLQQPDGWSNIGFGGAVASATKRTQSLRGM